MRFFIHTVTDTELIRDPEGQDFADQQMAEQEAAQVARDFMAAALREGEPPPLRWRVLLAAADDTVLMSLPFSRLVPDHEPLPRRPPPAKGIVLDVPNLTALAFGVDPPATPLSFGDARQLIDDVHDTMRRARERRANVRASITEAHQNLRMLACLLKALDAASSGGRQLEPPQAMSLTRALVCFDPRCVADRHSLGLPDL